MLKFLIPKNEYLTAHPLTWSDDVRQFLNVEIVDTIGVEALPSLPAQRALGSNICVNLPLLRTVGLSRWEPRYSGFGGFLYNCMTAVKTANGAHGNVSFSPDPIELKRPTGRVLLPAKHYNYREIPFLSFVTPEDVRCARCALRLPDEDAVTFAITSYYLAVLIALSQQAVKFLEEKRDAYPARVAYPTEDGKQIIVLTALVPASFLEKFEIGAIHTDPLQVTRTTITIGDGSSILEFAKEAVVSALEPEKPSPPIIRWKYVRTIQRPPTKQPKEGSAGSSV